LLNHWLWYKYTCHECSHAEFQVLFERIMKRLDPRFMSIRPYGRTGDRKCDGLLLTDGAATVFQVYSPDELKQEGLINKVEEDLAGAVEHWGSALKRWVFVYNVRRGVPPDVARLLLKKQAQYPDLQLDQWSSDALWEKLKALPLQDRAEILGAPNGYEHLFFSASTTDDYVRHQLGIGSFVLIQDLLAPINLGAVSEALAPGAPFGAPFFVRPTYSALPWTGAAEQQREIMREVMARGRDLVPRFAVFSLAPIPLAIHLGFLLSDRVEVNCYQYHREAHTWRWPGGKARADTSFEVSGLPQHAVDNPTAVAVCVQLSALIAAEDVREAAPNTACHISIRAAEPDVMWLCPPEQLQELARVMRRVLASVRAARPRCCAVHLFYAGPTGGAVALGQTINPRMNPPVHVYQYSQQTSPRYQLALTLTGELAL
jgi:hypothetical protein